MLQYRPLSPGKDGQPWTPGAVVAAWASGATVMGPTPLRGSRSSMKFEPTTVLLGHSTSSRKTISIASDFRGPSLSIGCSPLGAPRSGARAVRELVDHELACPRRD